MTNNYKELINELEIHTNLRDNFEAYSPILDKADAQGMS